MSEHLTQLCCLIIEDTYGSFLAHIFRLLAAHGKLPATSIAQRCHLLLRQAKAGLSTLVQLRLVQHHSRGPIASYQVDLLKAYDILRVGKVAHLAQRQFGPVAGLTIEVLASKGFAPALDLESTVTEALENVPEGDKRFQNGSKASAKVHDAMKRLADDGFIARIKPAHLKIPHDAREDIESAFESVAAGGQKGENLKAARAEKINAEMERLLDSFVSGDMIDAALSVPNGNSGAVQSQDELLLTIDFGRLVRSIRDASVGEHVGKVLGKASARLAYAALRQVDLRTEPPEPSPNPRVEEQQLTLGRLLDDIQKESLYISTHHTNGHSNGDVSMVNGVEDDFVDQETLEEGLMLLSEGPYRFLRRDAASHWWYMDRYQLATWLRDREIQNLIGARVGPVGMRLVRMLIDKGKLDEKLLQEMGLLQAKEMRQALSELQTQGMVELQEVPREPQRQPNRTIFLWFYDPIRARDLLLDQLYKSMARCYQRLQVVERERMQATLAKIEREDVKDRIEDFVVGPEMVALQQFQAKERWLMGEIARLDDSVALLRDI